RDSTVIHPPVDTDFYMPGEGRREDYYLCVSALVPYKRIDLAVRACRQIGRRLVVIGAGPEARKLARLGGAGVEWLGWRSDDEIRAHLRRCRALLFPGQEDFGIVPVEAQACGTPVVAYGRGGATETVLPADDQRSGTGVFFSEPTPEALADAMHWHESHPTRISPRAARRQALKFETQRYESEFLAYLDWVVEGGSTQVRRAA
ncbi:MAG TPA: glycosyltransferase, partial [Pirellulales bacterium]|nr:glycosyltransferase [Pirellulales bacterium]